MLLEKLILTAASRDRDVREKNVLGGISRDQLAEENNENQKLWKHIHRTLELYVSVLERTDRRSWIRVSFVSYSILQVFSWTKLRVYQEVR